MTASSKFVAAIVLIFSCAVVITFANEDSKNLQDKTWGGGYPTTTSRPCPTAPPCTTVKDCPCPKAECPTYNTPDPCPPQPPPNCTNVRKNCECKPVNANDTIAAIFCSKLKESIGILLDENGNQKGEDEICCKTAAIAYANALAAHDLLRDPSIDCPSEFVIYGDFLSIYPLFLTSLCNSCDCNDYNFDDCYV